MWVEITITKIEKNLAEGYYGLHEMDFYTGLAADLFCGEGGGLLEYQKILR